MKSRFTFHLISIHLPLPVAVVPVESASRTRVLPSAVSTVTRFPSMDTAWAQGAPPYGHVVGALDPPRPASCPPPLPLCAYPLPIMCRR